MPQDALTRHRGRKPAGFCQEQTLVMTEQFSSMERDAFHVPYLSDKIPEAVFHGQAVKTVGAVALHGSPWRRFRRAGTTAPQHGKRGLIYGGWSVRFFGPAPIASAVSSVSPQSPSSAPSPRSVLLSVERRATKEALSPYSPSPESWRLWSIGCFDTDKTISTSANRPTRHNSNANASRRSPLPPNPSATPSSKRRSLLVNCGQ